MVYTINNDTIFRCAKGYILFSPINSSENLPQFQASIKDGYAIKYGNNWFKKSNVFNVVQVSVAGTVVSKYFTFNIMCKHDIDII